MLPHLQEGAIGPQDIEGVQAIPIHEVLQSRCRGEKCGRKRAELLTK